MLQKLIELGKECTGCAVCQNVCPTRCIEMKADEEGFYKPVILKEKCIHCNKCQNVCPQINVLKKNIDNPKCYAVQASDEIREVSSSGGVFSILAEYIFDKGGYVCGAAYDPDFRGVSFIMIDDRRDMYKLRGSKYVYAKPGNIYQNVKDKLMQGEYVLFSGTPCQVAGLNNFLNKDYSNLLTVDFLCGGVPSEKVFRLYVNELLKKGTITNISFRNKKYGWDYYGIECVYDDGRTVYRPMKDPYFRAHVKWLDIGKACTNCSFAPTARHGDFSMGDFWQIEKILPEVDTDKGISCLLINNEKAQKVFETTEKWMKYKKSVPLSFLKRHNRMQEKKSVPLAQRRFYYLLDKGMDFSKAVDYSLGWKFDVALTGCWTVKNYGGVLTYYALYNVLKDMGYEVLMVERRADIPGYDIPKPDLFYENPYPFFDICRIYKNFAEQWELNNRVKCFICGSDQIWNYTLFNEETIRSYTMDYVSDWRKKVTYATSFGANYIKGDEKQKNELINLIKRLDHVSVREQGGTTICNDFSVKAEWVVDPVFLCDKQVYRKLYEKAKFTEKDKYLFSYFTNPNCNKYGIEKVAEKLKYGYIGIVNADENTLKNYGFSEKSWPYPYIANCKLEQWLNYLVHAKFIVTDSFHAVCFAIIYKIPFVFIQGKMTSEYGFGRIESLLKMLNLMCRIAGTVEEVLNDEHFFEPIDFDLVHTILDKEVERSREWLKNAIESDKNQFN